MVLAIDALKVAMRKENVANPLLSANNWFFPLMNTYRRNVERSIAFAIALFS
jgi:hypothetical protein